MGCNFSGIGSYALFGLEAVVREMISHLGCNDVPELAVGCYAFQAAIAQSKVALRKKWLAQTAEMEGEYEVRYRHGGVAAMRVA